MSMTVCLAALRPSAKTVRVSQPNFGSDPTPRTDADRLYDGEVDARTHDIVDGMGLDPGRKTIFRVRLGAAALLAAGNRPGREV